MENHKKPRGRPKSLFKESSAGTLQSLDRALETLTTLATLERCTLSDLSRETGVPTATTHRILTTLSNRGYVSFDEQRQEWMIGIEAYRTGASYLNRNSVVEIGRPILRRLMRDSGETANMAMPDGSHVVFVNQIETSNPIRAFFPPGARTPMYASGTGKALLAELSQDALGRLTSDLTFEPYTDRTHRSTASLFEDLTLIRQRGWSFDDEERYEGMSCTGAAIQNQFGVACAGISVSGPTARINKANAAYFGEMVLEAAHEITLAIGGQPR
ncbi:MULTISPECIES: IclR family transcriptional regulator [unclassified Ruegeria]|uniref:IclR family transcriptional regulator n=1 Tax=unclassified Ruegeria TaxID=2625375 RepID=UPI0014899CEE|nr:MULTISPECIES: IclR family transcriptional regulator [unclassified Ruegeria]NOD34551.1 helix-turn-helix domain-containing protein [Ruegeria sp. HKCCD7296]NOD47664.1 helix-turn-helix domain-containing protein [Ruegeria sp. HKCCD5849]NOD52673.1 helix-turn-helix domain-containing protein [Ruegeria sp. HKCCD5851]NOD66092.1 helix-turn-helix domain-containing protein [Ruegeria sp. HKCCD7303]NOE35745.1 helix-turn-helix domain-containing protein [Ruegeria sp. HKCCD7318]